LLLRAGTSAARCEASGVRCEGSAAEGEAGAGATGAAALGVTAGGEPMVSDGPGCGAWGELVVGEDDDPLMVASPIPGGSTRLLSFRVGEVVVDADGDLGCD